MDILDYLRAICIFSRSIVLKVEGHYIIPESHIKTSDLADLLEHSNIRYLPDSQHAYQFFFFTIPEDLMTYNPSEILRAVKLN